MPTIREKLLQEYARAHQRMSVAIGRIHTEMPRWPSAVRHEALNIFNYSATLDFEAGKPRPSKRVLAAALKEIEKAERLLANPPMLEPPERQNLYDLMDNIDYFLFRMGQFRGKPIRKSFPSELKDYYAKVYSGGIGQTVEIFLRNALRAHKQAGANEPIRLNASVANGHFQLEVTDRGRGIPEGHRHKVFKEQFTLNEAERGHGLGLLAAREMIEDHHGGQIYYRPEKNGSTFGFRIPLATCPT